MYQKHAVALEGESNKLDHDAAGSIGARIKLQNLSQAVLHVGEIVSICRAGFGVNSGLEKVGELRYSRVNGLVDRRLSLRLGRRVMTTRRLLRRHRSIRGTRLMSGTKRRALQAHHTLRPSNRLIMRTSRRRTRRGGCRVCRQDLGFLEKKLV